MPSVTAAVTVSAVGGLLRPSLIPVSVTDCGPGESGNTIGLGVIGLSVGVWLIGFTVIAKMRVVVGLPPLTVPPLSVTLTVMKAVPLTFGSTV